MRKFLALAAVLALLLSLCACGSGSGEEPVIDADPTPAAADPGSKSPAAPEATAVDPEAVEFWNGDWYGWWCISRCGGAYAELYDEGSWWDVCARVDLTAGDITLWDELGSEAEPLAKMKAAVSTRDFAKGCLEAGEGRFVNMETGKGYWIISPTSSLLENTVSFNGRYDDPDSPGAWFEYSVVLRPWAALWDDVPEDQRPFRYGDWYLPLVNDSAAMPEAIG